jgi:general secretion pathway protein H
VTTEIGSRVDKREQETGNRAHKRSGLARFPCCPFPVPRSRRAQRARGFTLIEILAVIVLIAIGVTIAAVSLHGTGRGRLDAAAQQVAAGLRDTRTRAVATSQPQAFVVDLRAHTFAAPGRGPRKLPAAAAVQVTSAAEDAAGQGVARIRFFPDGSSSGGHVELSEAHRTVRVDVDWLTGAVAVSGQP